MKRLVPLALAVLLVLALFAGCSGSNTKVNNGAEATDTPAATDSAAEATPEPTATPEPLPYAAGKFAADENGLATEKYDYPLPLSTTDEVLSMWTCSWTPEYLPEDGYGATELPQEVQKRTGVEVEYTTVAAAQRAENFAVLLASDSLLDIMASAASFYTSGPFKKAVTDEEYFVNLYDYRQYMPNYIYEALKDPEDRDTINTVFNEKNLILAFYELRSVIELSNGAYARGDWLEDMGKTNADIKTFDDLHDMLLFFKTEKGVDTPMAMFKTIEAAGAYEWVGYDTYACCNGIKTQYVVDGTVKLSNVGENDRQLMTMINQWYSEGLIDPNWAGYTSTPDFDKKFDTGEIGYVTGVRPTTMQGHNKAIPAGEKYGWVGISKPVLEEGQTLHMGFQVSRVYWGSASISTTCENIPLACTWLDWRYSEEGSFLYGYGVEGVSWNYDANGEIVISDFIVNHKAYWSMAMTTYALNSLSEPGLYINYTWKVPGNEAALQYLADWNSVPYDNNYVYPLGISYTDEQNDILAQYGADVTAYLNENYLAFVDGSKPLSQWDEYVAGVNAIGLDKVLEVYQEAYEAYMA